jgi:hypothetical protein
LFHDFTFYLHGTETKELRNLLKFSEATMQKKPNAKPCDLKPNWFIIVDDLDLSSISGDQILAYAACGYRVVKGTWIWQSASHYELQDLTKFEITPESLAMDLEPC